MTIDDSAKTLAMAIPEVLDRFGTLGGRVSDSYVEDIVFEIGIGEYYDALGLLQTLELVDIIDAGYAWLYSLTNDGIIVVEKHRSHADTDIPITR